MFAKIGDFAFVVSSLGVPIADVCMILNYLYVLQLEDTAIKFFVHRTRQVVLGALHRRYMHKLRWQYFRCYLTGSCICVVKQCVVSCDTKWWLLLMSHSSSTAPKGDVFSRKSTHDCLPLDLVATRHRSHSDTLFFHFWDIHELSSRCTACGFD